MKKQKSNKSNKSNKIDTVDIIKEYNSDALLADGFNDAIIGMCHQFDRPPVVAYDFEKVIFILMKDKMSREEAIEFWEYNMVGAGMGDNNCVYIEKL